VIGIAQEDTRPWMPLESRIGIAIGIGTQTFLDNNTSPLVYRSKPKNLRLFYQLESNDLLVNFDIDVKMGGLKPLTDQDRMLVFEEENYKGEKQTKKFPAGGSFLAAKISLGGYYKVKSTQESTFKVAVGLRVANEMFYPQGWTTSGLMNLLSLAPQAITQHRANEYHKFTAAVRLPLIAYITRPPYHNSVSHPNTNQLKGFFSNSQWSGIGEFTAPEVSFAYDYQLSTRLGTGVTYDINWYQVTTESKFRAMSQFVRASIYNQF
jgi:hypothetical protein